MTQGKRAVTKQSPAWRGHFRSQFMKTQMCRFFPAGLCKFGKDCCFAHTQEELSVAPDLTKTSICIAYQQGKCNTPGDQCPYAHGAGELRVTPAFMRKKLSRRTRQADADADASNASGNPQDCEAEVVSALRFASSCSMDSRPSSGALSEAERMTTEPSSPLLRGGRASSASLPQSPMSLGSPTPLHQPTAGPGGAVAAFAELFLEHSTLYPGGPRAWLGDLPTAPPARPTSSPPASPLSEVTPNKPVLCLSNILGDAPEAASVPPKPLERPPGRRQGHADRKVVGGSDAAGTPGGRAPQFQAALLSDGFASPLAGVGVFAQPSQAVGMGATAQASPKSPGAYLEMLEPAHVVLSDRSAIDGAAKVMLPPHCPPESSEAGMILLAARRCNLPLRVEIDPPIQA